MDMQQNSNVDLSTQAIPPVSNNPKKSNGIVTLLLLLVLILLGFILFAFFTDRLDIGIKNPFTQKEQTESEEEKDTEESDELNVYTNNQFGVEFKYPNNWKILEEKAVEDPSGDNLFVSFVNKTNSKMIVSYNTGLNTGPEYCSFTDAPHTSPLAITYDKFRAISDDLRAALAINTKNDSSIYLYNICKRYDEKKNEWDNWMKPGYLGYQVTKEDAQNKEFLSDVDTIVKSYKYTGDTF